jgi:raffinose/stachyose/melibiose transport system permease protein
MATPARPRYSPWRRAARCLAGLALAGFALVFFSPFVWMLVSAMKPKERIFADPWAPPERISFEPFIEAYRQAEFGRYFKNSLVVTALAALGNVALSSLAGYALARWRFRGQSLLLGALLAGLILPLHAYLIPLRGLVEALGLLDTRAALVLPYLAMELPMGIYILRAFFLSLPRELGESAAIDGASSWRIFFSIYLPLAAPAAASVGLITALASWNEFLLAFLFIQDESLRTIPAGLLVFQGLHSTDYQSLFAGLTLVSAPLIAVYLLAQRWMVAGLTAGALKG